MDYRKFDNIADSDEDSDEDRSKKSLRPGRSATQHEKDTFDQELLITWLSKQETLVKRADEEEARRPPPPPPEPVHSQSIGGTLGGLLGIGGLDTTPSCSSFDLPKPKAAPWKKLSKEERQVVARLAVLSTPRPGTSTNLDRHPEVLDVLRHNTWLEEDPQVLEFLCRAYNKGIQSNRGRPGEFQGVQRPQLTEEETRIADMILYAINTLAAPKGAGLSGGILELFTLICTPVPGKATELRAKWEKREFGKNALFDSLFPEMRKMSQEPLETGWGEIAMLGVLLVVLCGVIFYLIYTSRLYRDEARMRQVASEPGAESAAVEAAKETGSALLKGVVDKVVGGAGAAVAAATAGAGGGDEGVPAADYEASQKKIEELQRQIEELKRAQASAASTASTTASSPEL